MSEVESRRSSHCVVCGKRLSEKAGDGPILWQAGQVDDTGLYCQDCFAAKKGRTSRKGRTRSGSGKGK